MAVYLIADLTVTNAALLDEYLQEIPIYVDQYQGRYLVKGASPSIVEGQWQPEKMVVIEFPSDDQLQKFLQDPNAINVFKKRHQSTVSHLISVQGV